MPPLSGNFFSSSYALGVDLRIGQSAPDNLPPQVKGAFDEIYNAIQQIIQALITQCGVDQQPFNLWTQLAGNPSSILKNNMGRLYVTLGETVVLGAAISLYLDLGILKARNANATNNTRPCDGFCSTTGGGIAGDVVEVIVGQGVAVLAGLTIGTRYYLSLVNGLVTNVAPVAAGNIEQYLGVAVSTTRLLFSLGYWIQH